MANLDGQEVRISVFPQLGALTHKGTVGIQIGERITHLSPPEAREMAMHMLAASFVAEQEQVLVRWLVEQWEMTDQAKINAVVTDFRQMRIEDSMPGGGPPM